MKTVQAIFLLANAVWNFAIWPRFMVQINKDERSVDSKGKKTSFFMVHAFLVAVSLSLALLSLLLGAFGLAPKCFKTTKAAKTSR